MTDTICPVCGAALQDRTPLVPAASAYSCTECTYHWRGRRDL